MASSVGKVMSDPEPTIVLMVPARKPAPITSSASRTDMVPGTVDCWRIDGGRVPEEKQPVEKAVELFVYAPVGMALYVRDMLPSMMGIFVRGGQARGAGAPHASAAARAAGAARGEAADRRVGRP